MPRQRLIATVLLAISAFPLMLVTGQLGAYPPLAAVAIPLTAVLAYTIICVAARTRPYANDRAVAWLADLHPALGMAATGCAGACWLALQTGVYGLAGTILYDMLPVRVYPFAVIGLFAVVTVAGWWPWRSGSWRIGWLVWPGLIATWLLMISNSAGPVAVTDWISARPWLAVGAAGLVAVGVLGGTLSAWDGHADPARRTLARAATTTGSVALAACLGYAMLDLCSRLGSGPLGGPPTDLPPATPVGLGPLGFELAAPLIGSAAASGPGSVTVYAVRWLILAAVIVTAVLFARAGTDQIDALRRTVTGTAPAQHPSLTARIIHTAAVAVPVAAAATGYPAVLAYAGLATGGLGLLVVAGFGWLGHTWGWGEQHADPMPAPHWAWLTTIAPLAIWTAAVTRLPAILAWPWTDRRLWMIAAVYPLAAIAGAATAGWLRWRRRDAYDDISETLPGPDQPEHEALPNRGHRGWKLPDAHTVHVGDRIWCTLSSGQPAEVRIVAGDRHGEPIVRLPDGGLAAIAVEAIRTSSQVPA